MRIPDAGIPRFPGAGSSARGESVPKARPKGAADGQQVNIPVPDLRVINDDVSRKLAALPDGWECKPVGWIIGKSVILYLKGDAKESLLSDAVILGCLEKRLSIASLAVPKPTQVGGYQYTKARE